VAVRNLFALVRVARNPRRPGRRRFQAPRNALLVLGASAQKSAPGVDEWRLRPVKVSAYAVIEVALDRAGIVTLRVNQLLGGLQGRFPEIREVPRLRQVGDAAAGAAVLVVLVGCGGTSVDER